MRNGEHAILRIAKESGKEGRKILSESNVAGNFRTRYETCNWIVINDRS